ncbi:MAG: UbiA-like polyprenyltransferase [Myxococcota bacterium]
MADRPLDSLRTYSSMIKLSHSIFAMPFALAAAVLAARTVEVTVAQIGLILVCLVTARSAAMGFNRILDRDIDADNPRTSSRELPSGAISLRAATVFTAVSAGLFVLATALLGPLTLALSPIVLLVVLGYSYTKRYTAWCHAVLGLALALAPTGVWVALTGSYAWTPLLLSLAVGTWVAGFDILYSCQDYEFDRDRGLHSVPVALGLSGAMVLSAVLHLGTVGLLVAVGVVANLGFAYAIGVAVITAVLVYEHWIVRPDDLSRIDKAFFDLNGYVSLLFFAFVVGDLAW